MKRHGNAEWLFLGPSEADRLDASDQWGRCQQSRCQKAARFIARATEEDIDAEQEGQALAEKGMKLNLK